MTIAIAFRDCATRRIPEFPLCLFFWTPPLALQSVSPPAFRLCVLCQRLHFCIMKNESRAGLANGAAERSAWLLLLNQQRPPAVTTRCRPLLQLATQLECLRACGSPNAPSEAGPEHSSSRSSREPSCSRSPTTPPPAQCAPRWLAHSLAHSSPARARRAKGSLNAQRP